MTMLYEKERESRLSVSYQRLFVQMLPSQDPYEYHFENILVL
jgi:hypothetical protein